MITENSKGKIPEGGGYPGKACDVFELVSAENLVWLEQVNYNSVKIKKQKIN